MKQQTPEKLDSIVTIDAAGQRLGELAVRIARILQGKDRPDYVPYMDKGRKVVVENLDKLSLSASKLSKKLYWQYTGYPGGIHKKTLEDAWKQDPKKVLRHAVSGMLPKNKLHNDRLRKFEIK